MVGRLGSGIPAFWGISRSVGMCLTEFPLGKLGKAEKLCWSCVCSKGCWSMGVAGIRLLGERAVVGTGFGVD